MPTNRPNKSTEENRSNPRMTIADIAQLAAVSITSVSYYLNGHHEKLGQQTIEHISKIIQETGWSPNAQARALHQKQTRVIAVLIQNSTNMWAGSLFTGIDRCMQEHSYQFVLCTTHNDISTELMYVNKMLALGVDGFIIQPTSNFKAVSTMLDHAGKPYVFFDSVVYSANCQCIKSNLYDAIYSATTKLIASGYEEFVAIHAPVMEMRTRSERYQSFFDALQAHMLVPKDLEISPETFSSQQLETYFKFSLRPNKRTLVFVQNQWALAKAFKALQPMSELIPNTFGLLGINCDDWTSLTCPTISTIIEPVEDEGYLASKMLLQHLLPEEFNEEDALYLSSQKQLLLDCNVNWFQSTDLSCGLG